MTICQKARAEFDAVVMRDHKDLAGLSQESREHLKECQQCMGNIQLKLHHTVTMSSQLAVDTVDPKIRSLWAVLCTNEVIRLSDPFKVI